MGDALIHWHFQYDGEGKRRGGVGFFSKISQFNNIVFTFGTHGGNHFGQLYPFMPIEFSSKMKGISKVF